MRYFHSTILIPFIVTFVASLFITLFSLKSYTKEIDDYLLEKEKTTDEAIKNRLRSLIHKNSKYSVRNYIVRMSAISLLACSLVYGFTLSFMIEKFMNNAFQISRLPFDFIYSIWFLFALSGILILWIICIILQIIDTDKYKSFIIISLLLFLILGFFLSCNYIDNNYSKEVLSDSIINNESQIVGGNVDLNWDDIEQAKRYSVSVNGKSAFINTLLNTLIYNRNINTAYSLTNLLIPMQNNEVTLTAKAFGYKPSSASIELFYLPKIKKIEISGSIAIGQEISLNILDDRIDETNMDLICDNYEIVWLRNGKPIDGANSMTYILSPQDYENKISATIGIGTKVTKSNSIKPTLGEFEPVDVQIEKHKDYLLISYGYLNDVDWYDVYIDGHLFVTTSQSAVLIELSKVHSDTIIAVVLRGYGYNDLTSGYYAIKTG